MVWECGEGQTDRQTNTQTAMANIHFTSAMCDVKCNKLCPLTTIYGTLLISYYSMNTDIREIYSLIDRNDIWPAINY